MNPLLFFKLKSILQKGNYHGLMLEHPYLGWLGVLLKSALAIPFLVHSHNIEALRFKSTGRWWWRILWFYEKWVHRHADINFFITDSDREFAIQHYGLETRRCFTSTYGVDIQKPTSRTERETARSTVQELHSISSPDKILLFNGTLDYKPNLDALKVILDEINPLLLSNVNFRYKIMICGKNLPGAMDELKAYSKKNIIYAGFVPDISVYFKAADLFINPVTEGGGIKTKLVEALGYGLSCVSSNSGAIGIPVEITGGKMKLVRDMQPTEFAAAIQSMDTELETPAAFYEYFYWGNIAARAAAVIKSIT